MTFRNSADRSLFRSSWRTVARLATHSMTSASPMAMHLLSAAAIALLGSPKRASICGFSSVQRTQCCMLLFRHLQRCGCLQPPTQSLRLQRESRRGER